MYATFTHVWMAELWPLLAPIVNDTRAHFGLAGADSWAEVFARHDRILSVVPERFDAQVAARPEAMRRLGLPRAHEPRNEHRPLASWKPPSSSASS